MAELFIKQCHDLVDIAVDKGLTNIIFRTQIDDIVHEAQMSLFRELLKDARETKNPTSRNLLLPFEKKSSITVSSGVGSLPSDFEHEIELWATVSGVDRPVTLKDSSEFKKAKRRYQFRENDPIADDPTDILGRIYLDATKKIEVYPTTTPILIIYYKQPIRPIYYTDWNGTTYQHTYSANSSTDIEWSETVWDILKIKVFQMLGMTVENFYAVRQQQQVQPKETIAP